MEYQKIWLGSLPEGQYKIEYNGKSSESIRELIKRLEVNLRDLESGVISE